MKQTLQKELDALLVSLEERPSLLLHVCCAPCASYVLEYLAQHFDITICNYNPNIYPEEEFYKRREALSLLLEKMGLLGGIRLIEPAYDPESFLFAVRGLEREPEGGRRCEICFRLRLERAAQMAKELGSDFFTTTLSISPHKDAALLERIALEIASEYSVSRLPSDFKKRGGYYRSIELSRQLGLYRQDYCGCAFSKSVGVERED